jgi:hypothetical protein
MDLSLDPVATAEKTASGIMLIHQRVLPLAGRLLKNLKVGMCRELDYRS